MGAAALGIAGAAYAAQPRRSLNDLSRVRLSRLVPLSVGPWTGAVDGDVVPEQVDASVDHGQTLSLRYGGESAGPVMLIVSYHGPQSLDLKVHRPETCYTVAGFEGARPQATDVALHAAYTVPSVTFTARREDRIETVLYWTRVGDRFPQTLTEQRLDFVEEALRGVRADGLLMRASVIGADVSASRAVLSHFAQALVQAASPQGRRLFLGIAGAARVQA